jgi:hypothetical protein
MVLSLISATYNNRRGLQWRLHMSRHGHTTREQKWTFFEREKWIRGDRDGWGTLEREFHSESDGRKKKKTKQPAAEWKRLGIHTQM